MAKKNKDIKAAMQAVNRSLQKFDLPTQAMAVSAVAGIYAAGGKTDVLRAAGIGANVETMISAFAETVQFNAEKKRKKRRPNLAGHQSDEDE